MKEQQKIPSSSINERQTTKFSIISKRKTKNKGVPSIHGRQKNKTKDSLTCGQNIIKEYAHQQMEDKGTKDNSVYRQIINKKKKNKKKTILSLEGRRRKPASLTNRREFTTDGSLVNKSKTRNKR
jgi:hypothetical protein